MTSPRRLFRFDDPEVKGYPLLNSLVVPRPIAWVSSLSAGGVGNLAPHSFFTVACADPGVVQFTSVGAKDTLRNVQETGEFVVNVAPRWLLEQVNNSSARFDADTFEAEALGIVMEPQRPGRAGPGRRLAGSAGVPAAQHGRLRQLDGRVRDRRGGVGARGRARR